VDRAIRAGLIEDRGIKTYQLYLTAKGAALLGIDHSPAAAAAWARGRLASQRRSSPAS
jgi:hypothetical protein